MAVDVMHLSALSNGSDRSSTHSASFSPGHKADMAALAHTEKSRSAQDLARDYPAVGSPLSATNSPSRSSAEGDSLSELSWSGSPEEQQAVERIHQSRKQLEDEIDVRTVLIFIIDSILSTFLLIYGSARARGEGRGRCENILQTRGMIGLHD